MLVQLAIRNFALVESVTLEFEAGFNVLTGETGAGKSILIDALTAALGERAGAEVIRTGADRASIEAMFDVADCPLPAVQEAAEDGAILLAREINASGRSTFRVNGRMATAGALRALAADLIDIHGQHEHQSLLSPDRHVDFLDAWTGPEAAARRGEVQEAYAALRTAHRSLEALKTGERERVRMLDLYRFQLREIEDAAPGSEDEAALTAERSRLANAERLAVGAAAAREALDGPDGGAAHLIAGAARELASLYSVDATLLPATELLETAAAAINEASTSLRGYLDAIEASPERLEQVQDRLELYRQLKRKYGDTVEDVLAFRDRMAADVEDLSHSEQRREELEAATETLAGRLEAAGMALFCVRRRAAIDFEAQITAHLTDLSMEGTRFSVELHPPRVAAECLERGLPAALGGAEFLISANAGEPLRPLARIASGGEMSRVMLALKTAMAGSHPVALIFDEIDAGVGGKTAEALGHKMARLSTSNQVLCVTHLPQIAGLATRHFAVCKESVTEAGGARTRVTARSLDADARVAELARMLGGAEDTATPHARELLSARG